MSLPDVAATAHLEARLTSLESQLHLTEYRLRRDLLERDAAWRERTSSAMSLIARMLVEGLSRLSEPPAREPGE